MKFLQPHLRPLALVTALVAMITSLYFSEILHLPPCTLCWYQRIAMYPLVAIIAIGIFINDKKLAHYALPLSIAGLLIATYHNLLYYGVIPETFQPCSLGVSCTTPQLNLFGFLTIPLMSLASFAAITAILGLDSHLQNRDSN